MQIKNLSASIHVWFISVITLIVIMVGIGGITRLTGSGLSITEWKPIMGAIPPLNEHDWLAAFDLYKQTPQFQNINHSMVLSEFKFIFFWEWFHRLIGRLIGLVVLLPGLYFMVTKKISGSITRKVFFGFVLGGAQGFLGWFMVKSGLSELVYVSHFRLAAHLLLALFILGFWFDLYFEWLKSNGIRKPSFENKIPSVLKWTLLVFVIQLAYGAFVAGLKAGYAFPTFPTMNGEWIPTGILSLSPEWINLFQNSTTVQFMHRWIAAGLVALTYFSWNREKANGKYFLVLLIVQFLLGVFTLISGMNLALASLHQMNACIMVLAMTYWIRWRVRA